MGLKFEATPVTAYGPVRTFVAEAQEDSYPWWMPSCWKLSGHHYHAARVRRSVSLSYIFVSPKKMCMLTRWLHAHDETHAAAM